MRFFLLISKLIFIIVLGLSLSTQGQTLSVQTLSGKVDSLIGYRTMTSLRALTLDIHEKTGIRVYTWMESDDSTNALGQKANHDVYCQIFDKNMISLSPMFRVNQNTTGDQNYSSVRINQNDYSFVLAWASNHNSSNNYDIYAKKLDIFATDFTTVSSTSETLINVNVISPSATTTNGRQVVPLMAIDYVYNELIIGWYDQDAQDGSGYGVYARRMDYSGFTLTKDQWLVNTTTTDNQSLSDIQINPVNNQLYFTYVSNSVANAFDIKFRRFKRNSSNDYVGQTEIQPNVTVSANQDASQLIINKVTGNYIIAWHSTGQDGSGNGCYFRAYNKYDVLQALPGGVSEMRINIPTLNNQHYVKGFWDESSNYIGFFYNYAVSGGPTGIISNCKYQLFNGSTYNTYGVERAADSISTGEINENYLVANVRIKYSQATKQLVIAYPTYNNGSPLYGKVFTRSFLYSIPTSLSSNCSTDPDKLWTQETSFDEYGNIIAETRTYLDNFGRAKQIQSKNVGDNKILVKAMVYDAFNRVIVTTLPAPITQNCFTYNAAFVQDNLGHNYTSQYLANPVANSTAGTLGYYYSNNNTAEPYVATTGFPYNRINYTDTIYGGALVQSAAGDSLKYGAKHEVKTYSLPLINELDGNYLGVRNNFVPTSISTLLNKGTKEITTDRNGVETIAFKDKAGNTLASALVGTAGTTSVVIAPAVYVYNLLIDCDASGLTNAKVISNDSIEVWYAAPSVSNGQDSTFTRIYSGPASGYTLRYDNGYIGMACGSHCQTTFIYHIRSRSNFSVFRDFFSYCTTPDNAYSYGTYGATKTGKSILNFYLKSRTSWNLNLANAYTGMLLKMTSLSTGAVVYNGVASSLNIATIPVPDAYRLELSAATLPPVKFNYYKSATLTYYYDLNSFTYNFYDDAGRLVASVAPKGVNLASTSVPAYTSKYSYSTIGTLLTNYDVDSRLVTKVYRKDGKLRFSQDNKQKQSNKFSYYNYDRFERLVETGEYDPALDGGTPLVFEAQTLTPVANSVISILENTGAGGGLGAAVCSCRTNTISTVYSVADVSIPVTRTQRFIQGRPSKTYNANSATWYSYNEQGRLEWIVKSIFNFRGAGLTKTVTTDYTYDLLGNVLNVVYQKDSVADRFEHRYTYDLGQRLVQVETKPGAQGYYQNEAKYSYYQHGPIKRKELADSLQGIDYTYTVQGWLKTINHATLSTAKDPGADGNTGAHSNFATDVFGMQLQYFDGDYVRTGSNITNTTLTGYQNYFDGIVKGMRWETKGHSFTGSTMGMYAFKYDKKYQLTNADFGTVSSASEATFTSSNNYKLSNLTYDLNGNILTKTTNDGSAAVYDNFTYEYSATSLNNRLLDVKKTVSTYYATYEYDSIGQVSHEVNAAGGNLYLDYDPYKRVTAVYSNSGKTTKIAEFAYDERGDRIKKATYSAGVLSYTTWYVRDYSGKVMSIYDNRSGTLGQTEIPIHSTTRIGVAYKTGSTYTYDYELTDNLGNVRATIARTLVSGQANIVSWADYFPFGDIMPGRSLTSSYRFDYQGQYAEKDGETGWNHFDLRDYDARTGRWLCPDPLKQYYSPYVGMGNNWVTTTDPTGGGWNPFKSIETTVSSVGNWAGSAVSSVGNWATGAVSNIGNKATNLVSTGTSSISKLISYGVSQVTGNNPLAMAITNKINGISSHIINGIASHSIGLASHTITNSIHFASQTSQLAIQSATKTTNIALGIADWDGPVAKAVQKVTIVSNIVIQSAFMIALGVIYDQPEFVQAGWDGAQNSIKHAKDLHGSYVQQFAQSQFYWMEGSILGVSNGVLGSNNVWDPDDKATGGPSLVKWADGYDSMDLWIAMTKGGVSQVLVDAQDAKNNNQKYTFWDGAKSFYQGNFDGVKEDIKSQIAPWPLTNIVPWPF